MTTKPFESKISHYKTDTNSESLVLSRDAIMVQHIIIQFLLHYLSSGHLQEVKDKKKFKLLALKVVVVVYERWLLTRGSKYSDLM